MKRTISKSERPYRLLLCVMIIVKLLLSVQEQMQ